MGAMPVAIDARMASDASKYLPTAFCGRSHHKRLSVAWPRSFLHNWQPTQGKTLSNAAQLATVAGRKLNSTPASQVVFAITEGKELTATHKGEKR